MTVSIGEEGGDLELDLFQKYEPVYWNMRGHWIKLRMNADTIVLDSQQRIDGSKRKSVTNVLISDEYGLSQNFSKQKAV